MATKPATKKPHPGGRPTAYKPQYCARLLRDMAAGYTLTAWAATVGVCRDTVQQWAKVHPEFSDALKEGQAARQRYWESRLMLAGKRRGDAVPVIFALKNCCREDWTDKPDVNVTVNNEVQVDTGKSPEEWGQAELEAELKRRGALPEPKGATK